MSRHNDEARAWAERHGGQTRGFYTALISLVKEACTCKADDFEPREEGNCCDLVKEACTCKTDDLKTGQKPQEEGNCCDSSELAAALAEDRRQLGFLPDAFAVERPEDDLPRMLLCEVQHTSPLTSEKLSRIVDLYWRLDAAEVELRLEVVDRTGQAREVDLFHHALQGLGDAEPSLPLYWINEEPPTEAQPAGGGR